MDRSRYAKSAFGEARRHGGRHGYEAYFPAPIPRTLPLELDTIRRVSDAEASLGRLAGAGRLLPNPHLLVRPYLSREAVASTRIEGTQASLLELFDAEAADAELGADLEEVVNYIRAMEIGIRRLAKLPLSTRLIRQMHRVILQGVRGREHQPGELRRTQNWIGPPGTTLETAAFVPPPAGELSSLLSDWEHFVHEDPRLPVLVQAGMLHYQFETIHPFLDGNGRLGRLLIVFFLVARARLNEPLLYLSPYFEANRDAYYASLQGVRERGDIDTWLQFFLIGVEQQAADAVDRTERLLDLRERYRSRVLAATRSQASALVDVAFTQPVLTSRIVETRLGVTRPAALRLLRQLEQLKVLHPASEGPRGQRRWRAHEIIEILTAE